MYQKKDDRKKQLPESRGYKDLGCKEATWYLRRKSSCADCPFSKCKYELDKRKGEFPTPP